jgi:hypothetical protein
MFQRAAPVGYQQVSVAGTAVGLTLPVGPTQATASSCNLTGNQLKVGGTVAGTFAVGQTATGVGIPANTTITQQGAPGSNTWILSNPCTTETGEAVVASQTLHIDMVILRCVTASVNWRDDGVAPTASIGMPMLDTDAQFEYAGAALGIQFISQTGTAVLSVSYYKFSG